jgi:hypothetical protein
MYAAVPEIEVEQPSTEAPKTNVRTVVFTAVGLLLIGTCVVMMASDDAGAALPVQAAPSAWLSSAETELAVTLPKVTAEDCANVKDWSFTRKTVDEETGAEIDLVQVTANNLGGQGPNKSDKHEVRYSNVADEIDLILETTGSYVPNPTCKDNAPKPNKCVRGKDAGCPKAGMTCGEDSNGMNGRFGQVNVKGNTKAKLKFTLVDAGTNNPVAIAPEQKVFFSVFDLDNNGPPTQEVLSLDTAPDSYNVATPTEVKQTSTKLPLAFQSTTKGNDDDNPTDPLKMTDVQMKRAVWVTYKGTNTWTMTFGEIGNNKGKGGRNLLFAGRAQGACPPGPVAPPTGGCKVGIEGMIKGGGRICCPQKCDGSGGPMWVKHESAPNHCGGPSCDKSANGAMKGESGYLGGLGGRTKERYDNCCVGKPVSGGTSKETITAPYGLVPQHRFCAGTLGSDAPPCINKLSKVSDRL